MGVYHHFGSKQGLLEQLYLHGFDRLADRLNSVPPAVAAAKNCWALPSLTAAFAVDNEALYGLMFEGATRNSSPLTPAA